MNDVNYFKLSLDELGALFTAFPADARFLTRADDVLDDQIVNFSYDCRNSSNVLIPKPGIRTSDEYIRLTDSVSLGIPNSPNQNVVVRYWKDKYSAFLEADFEIQSQRIAAATNVVRYEINVVFYRFRHTLGSPGGGPIGGAP